MPRTYYERPKRLEKLSKNERLELVFDLINSFRFVKAPIAIANFLQDLLTAKEIGNLAKRLRIAKLLLKGRTYEEIVKSLHTSYVTVAKVSTWLTQGGSGFKEVISKLPVKYEIPKNLPPVPIEFQLPKVLFTLMQYSKAKSQNANLETFLAGVDEKEAVNKSLRQMASEEFKRKKKH